MANRAAIVRYKRCRHCDMRISWREGIRKFVDRDGLEHVCKVSDMVKLREKNRDKEILVIKEKLGLREKYRGP